MTLISAEDNERRMALYRAGLSDRAIAKKERLDSSSIRYWRKKRGLAPNFASTEMSAEDARIRRELFAHGLGERTIGKLLGRSRSSIHEWRAKNRIAPRPPRAKHRVISLDFVSLEGGGSSFHELIADQSQSRWLEEMGATVW